MPEQIDILLLDQEGDLFLEFLQQPEQQKFQLISHRTDQPREVKFHYITVEAAADWQFFNLGVAWGEYLHKRGGQHG